MNTNRTVVIFIAVIVLLAIPVIAATVSVTRDLPEAVSPETEFVVTLTQSDFLLNAGRVTETLPEGFTYTWRLTGNASVKEYDVATNDLTISFEDETTVTYTVKAGTAEQIEDAVFSGTYSTLDSGFKLIQGLVGGDTTLTLAVPTPTPTPTPTEAPPSGGGAGGGASGGGGAPPPTIPPAPPAETPPYIHLTAIPAEIPADGISTSTITAFMWDGEEWVLENLAVNFSTSLGTITASSPVVNGTATGTLTAGTEEGSANVTAEANLPEVGFLTNTTAVTFTKPGVTPTPTPTPTAAPGVTPGVTPAVTPSSTPKPRIPGFEAIFAIAGLLAIAYLVLMRRGKKKT